MERRGERGLMGLPLGERGRGLMGERGRYLVVGGGRSLVEEREKGAHLFAINPPPWPGCGPDTYFTSLRGHLG